MPVAFSVLGIALSLLVNGVQAPVANIFGERTLLAAASYCGDGTKNRGESCDDGNGAYEDGCTPSCAREFCGDGVTQTMMGETCDDGNRLTSDGCDKWCQPEYCGDGIKQRNEQCDDGGTASGDGCDSSCRTEDAYICRGSPSTCERRCGNGRLGLTEDCDDGNTVDGDGCNAQCEAEICGDGVKQESLGEECDNGPFCSDTAPDACRCDCKASHCGDGVKDANESCDDGANNSDTAPDACRTDCSYHRCGDKVRDSGEQCDPPQTPDPFGSPTPYPECNTSCMNPWCGDGEIHTGEECDNGVFSNSDTEPDACRTSCKNAYCGDKVTDSSEECDDGNTNELDGCRNTCLSGPVCGDGTVEEDEGEECDDGNTKNKDGCSSICKKEKKCAVCQYMNSPANSGCGGRPVDSCVAACQDGKDNDGDGKVDTGDLGCAHLGDDSEELGTATNIECRVYKGACMGWFEKECKEWLETKQTDVEEENKHMIEETLPLPSLDGCSDLRQNRNGHGLGCSNFLQLVEACTVACNGSLQNAVCEDEGCSVFSTKAEVEAKLAQLEQRGILEGKTFSFTGQQIWQNKNECPSTGAAVTYRYNGKFTRECQTCQAENSQCAQGGATAECSSLGDTKCDATRYCCAKGNISVWKGAQCSYAHEPMGRSGESSWYFGPNCHTNGAITEAQADAQNKLAGNQTQCAWPMGGTFEAAANCSGTIHGVGPFACYATWDCIDTCKNVLQ